MKVAILIYGSGLKQGDVEHAVALSNFKVTTLRMTDNSNRVHEIVKQWAETFDLPIVETLGVQVWRPADAVIVLWAGDSCDITGGLLPLKQAGKVVFTYNFKRGEGRLI